MNHNENLKKQTIIWAFAILILALAVPGVNAGGVDLTTVQTGTVNGDIAIYPGIMWDGSWPNAGGVVVTEDYALPAFDTVQWARLYVSVYCGSTSGARETFVNISLDGNGDGTYAPLADEYLNSTDMDVLPGLPHITRESSNYVMWYDVTDAITASTPSVQVNTTGSFDGRLKGVTLVVAYTDGREQTVDYRVNQGHYNGNDGTTVFDASSLTEEWLAADVTCLFLSSDSSNCNRYTLNDINLAETDGGKVTYSGYRILDATDAMETNANTFAWPGAGNYYRIPLAVLAVTSGPAPDLEVTTVVTNSDEYFAHEPNWIKAAVLNNGTSDAGAFDVAFTINGAVQTVTVPEGLPAGDTTVVEVTDATDYHLNDLVNVTVTADPDNTITELDETDNSVVLNATVVYNGYKGKRFTDGEDIKTRISHDGTINCTWSVGDSAYVSGTTHWTEITAGWTAEEMAMPMNATLRDVRLYVPYTWDKDAVMPDTVTLTFNGNETAYAAHYADQKSYGSSNYPYGMLVYNVTSLFSPDGNTAVLTKAEASTGVSMRGMTLVAVYEDAAEPIRSIFINEGFDLLYGDASKSTTPEEATAYAPFGDIDAYSTQSARLITFAPGANGPEGTLIVNNDSWTDVWSYTGSTQIGIDDRDVTASLTDGNNTCGFRSDAEYIESSGAILIIERTGLPDLTVTGIALNSGEIFAHEPNLITATVLNNGTGPSGPFSVTCNVNGNTYTTEIPSGLPAGNATPVAFTDPVDYPAGTLVTVNVTVDADNIQAETDETDNSLESVTTVVYNGYKGKRYTDGDDILPRKEITLNGDLCYSTGNSSYVMGTALWTTIPAGWMAADLPIPDGAVIREARLYIAYTWDKHHVMPDTVTITFNGVAQPYEAAYNDSKQYGSYNYPSGILVANVTDLFSPDGNTAILSKADASQQASVRGMLLLVVYEDAGEPMRTILINEEYDYLYGDVSKSTTPEEATAYAPLGDITSAASARLITVAPSANGPEGTLIFNNEVWENVWSYAGTSQIGIDDRQVSRFTQATGNTAAFRSESEWFDAACTILVTEPHGPVSLDIPLSRGWNMVSFPGEAGTITFPAEVTSIYTYNAQTKIYDSVTKDTITTGTGTGYWVAAQNECNISVEGQNQKWYTLPVASGWNMVGSLSETVLYTHAYTSPSGALKNTYYAYNATEGQYEITSTFIPGNGYWVSTLQNCILTLE